MYACRLCNHQWQPLPSLLNEHPPSPAQQPPARPTRSRTLSVGSDVLKCAHKQHAAPCRGDRCRAAQHDRPAVKTELQPRRRQWLVARRGSLQERGGRGQLQHLGQQREGLLQGGGVGGGASGANAA
jgi:hypothetical protein